jgi:hypothetical protein
MRDEHFRNAVLFVEHVRHHRLLNLDQRAIGSRGRRADAQRPAGEASLAEEVTGTQDGDDRFLALLGGHPVLHLASSDVEDRIRRVSLAVDGAVRAVFKHGFPAGDSRQEGFPIDELSFLLYRSNHRLAFVACHNNLRLLAQGIAVRPVFQNSIPANDFSGGGIPIDRLAFLSHNNPRLLRVRPWYQKESGFSDAPRTTSRVGLAARQSNCLRNFPLLVTRQPLSSNGAKDRPGNLIDFNVRSSFNPVDEGVKQFAVVGSRVGNLTYLNVGRAPE